MRLYLVRHGQTEWNQQNRAIGQTDVALSTTGVLQAKSLGARFQGISLDRILCSDLQRCRRTAQEIADATGAPVQVVPEIRERSFGDWEGQDYAVVNEKLLAMAKDKAAPFYEVSAPAGESHADIWRRVEPILAPFFALEEQTAIVSHGGTSRVMLAYLLQGTLATTFGFKFDNTAVTQLDRRPDGAFLLSLYNDLSHLAEKG